jgi:hypothetical protein
MKTTKKATYLNGTEIAKSDPFYNIVNHKPELPEGIEYLKTRYLKLASMNLPNTKGIKDAVFDEAKKGNCEYLDAHIFCEVYLK